MGTEEENSAIGSAENEPSTKQFMEQHFQNINSRLDAIQTSLLMQQSITTVLEKKVNVLEHKINDLVNENEGLQKLFRKKNVLISGIEEAESENSDESRQKVLHLIQSVLKCNIMDVDTCYRIGAISRNKTRQVKVSFITNRDRDTVMSKKRDTEPPIYINEDLPLSIRKVHKALKDKKKEAERNRQSARINWKEKSITIDGVKSYAEDDVDLTS